MTIDIGASYCVEGESPSIITSGRSRSLSSTTTLLCLFGSGDIYFGEVLLFDKNLSNVCCFCRCFNIFLIWAITLSLNMFTVLFVITMSG